MNKVDTAIPGYDFGAVTVAPSPVSMRELEDLKITVGFSKEVERYLRMAGGVLATQTKQIVDHWRSEIIAGIPNLARHSRSLDGKALPDYLARSNRRFERWILDTCLRPYDQEWLNYQQEIAVRHTSVRKNKTDGVNSTAYIPLRDIVAFAAVMNETMKPYLAAQGHAVEEVEGMHRAWCKSIQLQLSLWARPYLDNVKPAVNEW